MTVQSPSPGLSRAADAVKAYFPGVLVCLTIATAARFLSDHYGAPQMLFALLLGLAFHFLADDARCLPGIELTAQRILRVGVALLGMRITVDEVVGLGLGSVAWVALGVVTTILIGAAIARLSRLRGTFGVLSGGAVAICGASAALALSAVLPRHAGSERNTIFVVISVTTLSTVAMVAYPIAAAALGLDAHAAGLFLGGTIHDVAQVVGAGYSLSPEVGDIATVTKLFRVAMLVPVVFAVSLLYRGRGGGVGRVPVPLFIVFFCLFVAANSMGLVPEEPRLALVELSRWCLVAAIAALGIRTSLGSLATVGPLPIALIVGETAFIALWVLGGGLLG